MQRTGTGRANVLIRSAYRQGYASRLSTRQKASRPEQTLLCIMLFCPESAVLQQATVDRAYGNEIPTDIRRRPDHQSQNARTNRTVNQDLVMC